MEIINRRRFLMTLPITILSIVINALTDFAFIWTQYGFFTVRSWRPVQMKQWNRAQLDKSFNQVLKQKQFEQILPKLKDKIKALPIGSGFQTMAVSEPPLGYFVFKHGQGYLSAHIEVICIPSDLIKIEKKTEFLEMTFHRFQSGPIIIDDNYWRKLAHELGVGIIDLMNYPPKLDTRKQFDGNTNQNGEDALKRFENEIKPKTRGNDTNPNKKDRNVLNWEPTISKSKIQLPGDWLIIPLQENFCSKMATEHGLDGIYYDNIIGDRDVNSETQTFIHIIIGAILIRLKALHVKNGNFHDIWSYDKELYDTAIGWIGERSDLAPLVVHCSRLALDLFFVHESPSNMETGTKQDPRVIQAIKDEIPFLVSSKQNGDLNVEKYHKVELKWTTLEHTRIELETIWLTDNSWIDENIADSLRGISPLRNYS